MIVKTPGSQMGSPAVAEEGGEEMGGGRWESGERSEVQARSTLTKERNPPHWGGFLFTMFLVKQEDPPRRICARLIQRNPPRGDFIAMFPHQEP